MNIRDPRALVAVAELRQHLARMPGACKLFLRSGGAMACGFTTCGLISVTRSSTGPTWYESSIAAR